jgi:hypothetical protein
MNLTLPDYVIGGEPATPHSSRLTPPRTASGPPAAFRFHSNKQRGRDAVARMVSWFSYRLNASIIAW